MPFALLRRTIRPPLSILGPAVVKVHLVLTGDRKLNSKLRELTGPQARKAIRTASRAALKPVAAETKKRIPKRSGKLRGAVKVRALKRSRSRIGSRVTTGVEGSDFAGKAFYGAFLELGWKSGSRTGPNAASRVQQPGRRWIRDAAEASKPAALSIYRRKIQEFFLKVAGGGR